MRMKKEVKVKKKSKIEGLYNKMAKEIQNIELLGCALEEKNPRYI